MKHYETTTDQLQPGDVFYPLCSGSSPRVELVVLYLRLRDQPRLLVARTAPRKRLRWDDWADLIQDGAPVRVKRKLLPKELSLAQAALDRLRAARGYAGIPAVKGSHPLCRRKAHHHDLL